MPSRVEHKRISIRKIRFDGSRCADPAVAVSIHQSFQFTGGLITPLHIIRNKRDYLLAAGRNRIEAAKLAGHKKVPCLVFDLPEDRRELIYFSENVLRKSVNKIQRAEMLSGLADAIAAWIPLNSGQLVPKRRGRPKSTDSAIVEYLPTLGEKIGARKKALRRARKIAALPREVKTHAIQLKMHNNQRVLLAVAGKSDGLQAKLDLLTQLAARVKSAYPRSKSRAASSGGPETDSKASGRVSGNGHTTTGGEADANEMPEESAASFEALVDCWRASCDSAWKRAENAERAKFLRFLEKTFRSSVPDCERLINDLFQGRQYINVHDLKAMCRWRALSYTATATLISAAGYKRKQKPGSSPRLLNKNPDWKSEINTISGDEIKQARDSMERVTPRGRVLTADTDDPYYSR